MKLLWPWEIGKKLDKLHRKKLETKIHSEETFEQILLRERIRCDRNGHKFSLVIFEIEEKSQEAIEKLVRILHKRQTRLCDEVGLFHKQNIGVILCCTDRQSALSFAEDIRYKASSNQQTITFTVYEYPDNWQDIYHKNGSIRKHHFNGIIKKNDKNNSERSIFYSGEKKRRASEAVSIHHNEQNPNNLRHNIKIPLSFKYGTPAWKRVLDITGSLLGLVILLPLFLFISLVIKIVSPGGSVFIKEERLGYLGKRLTLWRFRTEKINKNNTDK
ncbi:MAG: sugar transferase [Candidatus Scalinduaceae bacterium]